MDNSLIMSLSENKSMIYPDEEVGGGAAFLLLNLEPKINFFRSSSIMNGE